MEISFNFSPDHRLPEETTDPFDIVRYDLPHKADLIRKIVTKEPKVGEIVNAHLGTRTYNDEERKGPPTGPEPVFVTHEGSKIYSRHPEFHGSVLGENTPKDAELHQLEDRVMVKSEGKPLFFDELPEVRELQYRISALPAAREAIRRGSTPEEADELFRRYKETLEPSHLEPLFREPRYWAKPHPKSDNGRQWDGYPYLPKESFYIKERNPENEDDNSRWRNRDEGARGIDFYKHAYENISSSYDHNKQEGVREHLEGLTNAFHKLWDKFDSGEYQHHPHFWSGHAFSRSKTRDSSWDQLISQVPEIDPNQ